jgi:DNA polymerase-4
MPLARAASRCPEAVFLPSDLPAYEAASARVMATLRSFPVVVEVWGWDEAFVGIGIGAGAGDPERVALAIQDRVQTATGLTCAVGIGRTRLHAKTATGFAKPGGVARLSHRTWMPTMGGRPVTALWGIGKRTAARLAVAGITTVSELASSDHHELARQFGPTIGPNLKLLGLGGGHAPLTDAPHVPRSRSKEETFDHDLTERADIDRALDRLARAVTESVVAEGRRVTHVAVKVRTATFYTRTKISKLPQPATDPAEVAHRAHLVLDRFELDRPVRLVGVRVMLEATAVEAGDAGWR